MFKASRLIGSAGIIAFGLYGCASTAPKPKFTHPIVAEARIASPDQAAVSVDASDDSVKILPMEREKFAEVIKQKIDTRKGANASSSGPRSFAVDLHLSRYDKGNAFARAMLAGVGQIHIEGKVQVYQLPDHALIGEFQMSKTFAWGGIYGASTSMEDIESTFADGVAATLTGQNEKAQARN
jgi:Domain of unknown function (DUF4410)